MSGPLRRARGQAAVTLLAAVLIAWAVLPAGGARPGLRAALALALVGAAGTAVRLALGDIVIGGDAFDPVLVRMAAQAAYLIRIVPWSEGLIVAVLVLEALHPARPWHTAVLGVALLAFLLAAHLAETGARPATLAPQLPVVIAGLGLLALAVGAAALPALAAGPGATALRILAIVAAVLAGALALPTTSRGDT